MARHKGKSFLSIIMPAEWVETIRAHADASGESMSSFVRRMLLLGMKTAIANGTIHVKAAKAGAAE